MTLANELNRGGQSSVPGYWAKNGIRLRYPAPAFKTIRFARLEVHLAGRQGRTDFRPSGENYAMDPPMRLGEMGGHVREDGGFESASPEQQPSRDAEGSVVNDDVSDDWPGQLRGQQRSGLERSRSVEEGGLAGRLTKLLKNLQVQATLWKRKAESFYSQILPH